MFFFDFALVTIIGAATVAAGIGTVALIGGWLKGRDTVDGDCRDTEWILHGEGSRNC